MNYKLAIMFNYTADRFAVAEFEGAELVDETWGYSAEGAMEKCQKSIEPAPAQINALDLGAGRVVYVFTEKSEESK